MTGSRQSPRVAKSISSAVGLLSRLCFALAGICLVLVAVMVTVDVLVRNLLDTSIYISGELSGYLLVATVFLGTPYALRKHALVRVELLYGRLPARYRFWADVVVYLLSLVYAGVLLNFCLVLTLESYGFGTTSTYATQTPLFIPQALMVLGMFVLLLELCAGLIETIAGRSARKGEPGPEEPGAEEPVADDPEHPRVASPAETQGRRI